AIQEGYRGLLMTGRYAVVFLFVELPPDAVDVNVHPTKAEVRFRDGSAMFHLVLSAIRARLNEANLVPRLELPAQPNAEFGVRSAEFEYPVAPPPPFNGEAFATPSRAVMPPESSIPHSAFRTPHSDKALQIHDSYLVIETQDGMLVIDQHA